MDPILGWPSEPMSLRAYSFAAPNPINSVDPTGLYSVGEIAIGIAAGGLIGVTATVVANYSLGRTTTTAEVIVAGSIGAAIGAGLVVAPLAGLVLAPLFLYETTVLTVSVLANPESSAGQKVAAGSLLMAVLAGTGAGLRYFRNNTSAPKARSVSPSSDRPTHGANSGGAGRAARFGSNWQRASLARTVERIAGKNPLVESTASGKQIYRNPDTGLQVVYDVKGNYFRVENPAARGPARYLDQHGNEIPPNVFLVGRDGSTQTGVPKDVRQALTHFLNVD